MRDGPVLVRDAFKPHRPPPACAGGKATQAKVRKIFPACEHRLFDIADDMPAMRRAFKGCFTALGKEFPESFGTLESEAARYMALNNTVVLDIRCLGKRAAAAAVTAAAIGVAAMAALRWARR